MSHNRAGGPGKGHLGAHGWRSGTADFLRQHEAEFLRIAPGRPRDAILIGGADHLFNVFQPELGHADRVVIQTVDWVRKVL